MDILQVHLSDIKTWALKLTTLLLVIVDILTTHQGMIMHVGFSVSLQPVFLSQWLEALIYFTSQWSVWVLLQDG